MFEALTATKPDALVIVAQQYRADRRPDKLDFGVGVYRDEYGLTPVLASVKQAELRLQMSQSTKAYVAPDGDQEFISLLNELILGPGLVGNLSERLVCAQGVGGTGSLRLAGELIATAGKAKTIWVGLPTWPNHIPLFKAAGLNIKTYPYLDLQNQTLMHGAMTDAFRTAEAGDVILLHGCCHNPTGTDFSYDDWVAIGTTCLERGLVPLIDLAYHGLGRGIELDTAGVRLLFSVLPEVMLATSCSKSFGLYRERTGALVVLSENSTIAHVVRGSMQSLARTLYSMPPDHGAAVVRVILSDPELRAIWEAELSAMRARISLMRHSLANAGEQAGLRLSTLATQAGLFTTLPITPDDVSLMRDKYAIFMPDTGRLNMAGLTEQSIPQVVAALAEVLPEGFRH